MAFGKRGNSAGAADEPYLLTVRKLGKPALAAFALAAIAVPFAVPNFAWKTGNNSGGKRPATLKFAPKPKYNLAELYTPPPAPQAAEIVKEPAGQKLTKSEVKRLPDGTTANVTRIYNEQGKLVRTITENPDGTESYTIYR